MKLAILFLVTLLFQIGTLNAQEDPNILFILVDDMGYGDPRCFNPKSKIATPHIDQLAAEGMRFTDAHAGASICVPSRYSLLSGRMPYRNWNATSVKQTSGLTSSSLLVKSCRWLRGFLIVVGSEELRI